VAARIQLIDRPTSALVTGTAVGVQGAPRGHVIVLVPDDERLAAVELLLASARGQSVPFQHRAERFLAQLPVVVAAQQGGELLMTTRTISAGGCGLAWSGPPPAVGDPVVLRFGVGQRAATFEGTVCWRAEARMRSVLVGVRFAPARASPGAWSRVQEAVARLGALPA